MTTRTPPITGRVDDQGPVLWTVTFGSIGLWLIHVGTEISLVEYSTTHHWARQVMTGLTVVLAALAALLTVAAWRVAARSRGRSGDEGDARIAFLGRMGVYIGVFDVVLIIVEGVYLVTLHG